MLNLVIAPIFNIFIADLFYVDYESSKYISVERSKGQPTSTNLTEHFVIVCSNKDISALTIEPRYSDRFI